ncbi:uncharacterized protein LOC21406029 [Morus notabilis]|uniref:uncharacterized protein LOC21406029 n=1 Tax=Morus notabilis TaxID=981085 RepID=UPI000CED417A|nr:uncharacterized protein LOC21406029 [Morus notabilis]
MASSVIISVLLMLSMSSCCNICVFGLMNVSVDEELELERQLKILNKRPIKTIIQTEDGNIFHCVATTKQPALDHPLLNDHKVQVVSLLLKPKFRIYGAGGRVSIQSLVLAPDQFSSADVWIQSGPSYSLNYIAAGWMVSPKLYGDSRTRLFTYWTADGNHKTGCYNTLCPGFVQVSRKITRTSLVSPASKYGGTQYDLKIQVFHDRKTGNWWFFVSDRNQDIPVGYWPRKLVAWGGIAKPGKKGISPRMGNGHFPDGNYRHACYFSHVHYVNNKNKMVPPGNPCTFQNVDKPKCYRLKNDLLLHQKDLGYSFTFGGPGVLFQLKEMAPRRRPANQPAQQNQGFLDAMYAAFQGMATRARNERPVENMK